MTGLLRFLFDVMRGRVGALCLSLTPAVCESGLLPRIGLVVVEVVGTEKALWAGPGVITSLVEIRGYRDSGSFGSGSATVLCCREGWTGALWA